MKTWFKNNSNQEYHQGEGVSSTELVDILRSPAYYKASREARVETPAMRLGTYIHESVLEPDKFDPSTVEVLDGRTKVGSPAYERKKVEWLALIQACTDAVRSEPEAMKLLSEGEAELSCYLENGGLIRKCRSDWINRKAGYIVDLKTTSAKTFDELLKSIMAFRYDVSQSNYREIVSHALYDGLTIPDFYWIFVSKEAPHNVWVVKPSEDMLEHGLECVEKALKIYQECSVSSVWPKEDAGPYLVEYPSWYRR